MATLTGNDEDAALVRVDAGLGQHDVVAITAVLAAHLGSACVVVRCCQALRDDTIASAAASADVLLLVLEAVRRHAESGEVTLSAWALTAELVCLNFALATPAVEGGALELALASVDDASCPDTVTAALLLVAGLLDVRNASRAVQLGVVEVRCLLMLSCLTLNFLAGHCTSDATLSRLSAHTAGSVQRFRSRAVCT